MMRLVQSALMCASTTAGPVCLKKPHRVITLRFSEVVKDHANSILLGSNHLKTKLMERFVFI